MIDAPAIMNRMLPTIAFLYNSSGELYWSVNYADGCTRDNHANCPYQDFQKDQWSMDAWVDQLIMGGNGDGQLTYPGRPERIGGASFVPIASMRLKHIRDGVEDF